MTIFSPGLVWVSELDATLPPIRRRCLVHVQQGVLRGFTERKSEKYRMIGTPMPHAPAHEEASNVRARAGTVGRGDVHHHRRVLGFSRFLFGVFLSCRVNPCFHRPFM